MTRLVFLLFLFAFCIPFSSFAGGDTTDIPVGRQIFHDRIKEQQKRLDKMDGKSDGIIRAGSSMDINLQVTDALMRKIDGIRNDIETDSALPTNNDKVRYLRYIETLLKNFETAWKYHKINPALAPLVVSNFQDILNAGIKGGDMSPYIASVPYEVGAVTAPIFTDNPGYNESKIVVFRKFCRLYPDKILVNIGPYVNEPFADTLVIDAFKNSPSQLYTYAQSTSSAQGKLLRRNTDPRIKTVVQLSTQKRALFYFPFLDDLISGKKNIGEIGKLVGSSDKTYDSLGYYSLLVQTEIGYYKRLVEKDTPVAMLGANGLLDMLKTKAIQHFINPINELHENPNPNIRFRAIQPLNAQELYYMMVLGENDIYTSSYKYSFDRMMQKMGPVPHGDSLLISLGFDKFKKFIKMAAGYNKLDTFLRTMPGNSEKLMQAFVARLETTGSLEDAVDVADSYGSITNPQLLQSMLQNVEWNEQRCIRENNERGRKIYNILKTIFLSADPKNGIDLSKEIGIPPVYTVDYKYLADDSGRIVEQVFFYGDKDGKESYADFLTSFPRSAWSIVKKPEWIEIKSLKGKPIWIFANLPLDNDTDKDAAAQEDLINYLESKGLKPSIVIHRGHSYHLSYTIEQLPENAKIIMLGSCGGYQNLKTILKYAPEAHIISTKQTGAKNVNKPIIDALDKTLNEGKNIDWREMWQGLDTYFSKTPRSVKETFDDYIPPHKNLGALFIKAYNKETNNADEAE